MGKDYLCRTIAAKMARDDEIYCRSCRLSGIILYRSRYSRKYLRLMRCRRMDKYHCLPTIQFFPHRPKRRVRQIDAVVIAVKNYSISLQLVIRAINLVQSCIDVREGERCEVPKAIRTSLYETRSVIVHLASDRRSLSSRFPAIDTRGGERKDANYNPLFVHKTDRLFRRPFGRAPPGGISAVATQLLRPKWRYQMGVYIDSVRSHLFSLVRQMRRRHHRPNNASALPWAIFSLSAWLIGRLSRN